MFGMEFYVDPSRCIGCKSCLQACEECDTHRGVSMINFDFIDREETIGTLIEVGAAYAAGKPIFIAFTDEELARHFYFAQQLVTGAVITVDVKTAWDLFARWRTNN